MKKNTIALFIVCCFFSFQVFSQGNKPGKIDSYCNNIDSIISSDYDTHTAYMVHSVNFETNKRAIGKQYTTIRFYYPMPLDSVIETEKETSFIYVYKSPVKINVEYNIAASRKNTIDYYFNDKGKLILYKYLSEGENGCISLKKYFNKNKLIKDAVLKLPGCNEGNDIDLHRNPITEKNIIENAKAYLKLFDTLVNAEQSDK